MQTLAKWIGRASAPLLLKIGAGLVATIFTLIAVLGVQTWRLETAQQHRADARANLAVCEAANKRLKGDIHEINEQAAKDVAAAERARVRAQAAARRAEKDRAERDQALEATRARLATALAGNECAGSRVPDDVDSLFREGNPRAGL